MKMDGSIFAFGFIVGAAILFCIAASPWSSMAMANKAIAACEKDLPRSQRCEVTAIPKEPHNE